MKASHSSANWAEDAKRRAAREAIKHVKNGHVVGLGSGSTAAYAIQEIGRLVRRKKWQVFGIPTSHQAFLLAVDCGIQVTTLDEHPKIDVTIDGADEINPDLNMIKGMGGALAREKIVASASELEIIAADETKLVKKLGTNHPVPVEVLPSAVTVVMSRIREFGGKPILRVGTGKVGPVVTDNGNFLLDVSVKRLDDPRKLEMDLKCIPGVVETGLFIDLADIVYVGTRDSVKRLDKKK